jgi:hypothetical protein
VADDNQCYRASAATNQDKKMRPQHLKSLVSLLLVTQFAFAQAPAPKTPVTGGISLETVVATLQSNGFQAKLLDTPPPSGLLLGQIISGISGVNVLVGAFKCANSDNNLVCALLFTVTFKDVTSLSDSDILSLNASSFAKAAMLPGGEGKIGGLRVTYAYPCEGFEDPKFIPMVLKNFGSALNSVMAKYKTLQQPNVPSTTTPAKP